LSPPETKHDQQVAEKIRPSISLAGPGGKSLRIALGVGLVLVATAVRLMLAPVWGPHYTFLTFFPALLLAAIFGGLEGGLLATALSGVLAKILWLTPAGFFSTAQSDWWALAAFMSGGALTSWIVDSKQRAEARAHAAEIRSVNRVTFDTHQRLQALLQALPVGVHFSKDVSCQFIDGNKAALAQFESIEGDNISASADDDRVPGRRAKFFIGDRQITASEMPIQRAIAENQAIPSFEMAVELPSGRTWLAEASAAPIHDQQGNVISAVAVMVDITERKRVEEALRHTERLNLAQEERSKLSGRLIEAQEKERARIARELHDDICQQLAFLSIRLDQLRLNSAASSNTQPECGRCESERLAKLTQVLDICREIGKDVQTLSHEIHSSKLDHIGLASAVSSFCKESAEKNRVEVKFNSKDVPATLTNDVSLCLFRIVQESLRNGIKHSGATCFDVSLRGERDGIELKVNDQGAGFDPKEIREKAGLGLVSIQERVNLVNGTINIESAANQGTTITAWVPVVPIVDSKYELTMSQSQSALKTSGIDGGAWTSK
jgi:signal transduction histidine kinase